MPTAPAWDHGEPQDSFPGLGTGATLDDVETPDGHRFSDEVVRRAFLIAAETGETCRPVHLLLALTESAGSTAAVLRSPLGRPLLERSGDPLPVNGGRAGYLVMQTQRAARGFAARRGEEMRSEHLLLAVVDQAEPEVLAALVDAGLDVAVVQTAVLEVLGAPADLPSIPIPPLTPAGTLDRPPLGVDELDASAWAALCWRQERLPLARLRRPSHYASLGHLESGAAWRVASRLALDEDQRFSLVAHHRGRVEQLAAAARPQVVEVRRTRSPDALGPEARLRPRRRSRRPRWLRVPVGWGIWFLNRQVDLRDGWFRLRTLGDYRGAPQILER